MKSKPALAVNPAPAAELLAIHVMAALTMALRRGERTSFEALARELRVRRVDVRRTLSALHAQGFVDAARMRPTMLGLTLGVAVRNEELRPLRPRVERLVQAA